MKQEDDPCFKKKVKSRISKILDMAKIVIYVSKSSKCMGLNYTHILYIQ